MLRIAQRSSDMHWFNPSKGQTLSPIGTLVKILATLPRDQIPSIAWNLARTVFLENGVLQVANGQAALWALVASLRMVNDGEGSINAGVFAFLDDCLCRLTRKPIKYEDDLDQLLRHGHSSGPVSLLHLVLVEQWPYATERETSSNIARWIRHYFRASAKIASEDERALSRLALKYEDAGLGAAQPASTEDSPTLEVENPFNETGQAEKTQDVSRVEDKEHSEGSQIPPVAAGHFEPPQEHPDAPGLHRWSSKDVPSAIADGDLSALVLCLSSQYSEVRPAALRHLRTLLTRIGQPTDSPPFEGASQIWVLIGSLINTVEGLIERSRADDDNGDEAASFPSIVTIYASLASRIIMDPIHPLYTAINEFHLNNGPPKWNIDGLAKYWTHTILYTHCVDSRGALDARPKGSSSTLSVNPTTADSLEQPYIDRQVANANTSTPQRFLLTLVYLSLRTEQDLDTIRQYGVLEPLLSMASLPDAGSNTVEMLLKILWRITTIPGGSDMLVTRKGVVAWLAMRLQLASSRAEKRRKSDQITLDAGSALRQLVGRIWDTANQQRAAKWGGDDLRKKVERLASLGPTAPSG